MTVTKNSNFLIRGRRNWWTGDGGLDELTDDIVQELNNLSSNGVTASSIWGVNTQSSATDITLSTLEVVQNITTTAAGLFVRLPSASGEGTVYEGQTYTIINSGQNAFDIQDNGGTVIFSSLAAGGVLKLTCLDDSTAAGTWQADRLIGIRDVLIFGGGPR